MYQYFPHITTIMLTFLNLRWKIFNDIDNNDPVSVSNENFFKRGNENKSVWLLITEFYHLNLANIKGIDHCYEIVQIFLLFLFVSDLPISNS